MSRAIMSIVLPPAPPRSFVQPASSCILPIGAELANSVRFVPNNHEVDMKIRYALGVLAALAVGTMTVDLSTADAAPACRTVGVLWRVPLTPARGITTNVI